MIAAAAAAAAATTTPHVVGEARKDGADSEPPPKQPSPQAEPSPVTPRRNKRLAQLGPPSGVELSKKAYNRYYTEEALRRRLRLRADPAVVAALDAIWAAATGAASRGRGGRTRERLTRKQYLTMHRKIALALDPTVAPREAAEAAEEEWALDSEGRGCLDREKFDWCWFELADLWTETVDADEYVRFLTTMLGLITTTRWVRADEGGGGAAGGGACGGGGGGAEASAAAAPAPVMVQRTVWQDDREVMRGHYAHRRLMGHAFTDEDNYPKALTRWLPFMHRPSTDGGGGGSVPMRFRPPSRPPPAMAPGFGSSAARFTRDATTAKAPRDATTAGGVPPPSRPQKQRSAPEALAAARKTPQQQNLAISRPRTAVREPPRPRDSPCEQRRNPKTQPKPLAPSAVSPGPAPAASPPVPAAPIGAAPAAAAPRLSPTPYTQRTSGGTCAQVVTPRPPLPQRHPSPLTSGRASAATATSTAAATIAGWRGARAAAGGGSVGGLLRGLAQMAAPTAPAPTVSSSASQPHGCCYGGSGAGDASTAAQLQPQPQLQLQTKVAAIGAPVAAHREPPLLLPGVGPSPKPQPGAAACAIFSPLTPVGGGAPGAFARCCRDGRCGRCRMQRRATLEMSAAPRGPSPTLLAMPMAPSPSPPPPPPVNPSPATSGSSRSRARRSSAHLQPQQQQHSRQPPPNQPPRRQLRGVRPAPPLHPAVLAALKAASALEAM